MPLYQPLRGDRAFTAVFRRGRRQDGRLLALRALPNDVGKNRLGFNVSRRLGGAVQRNRIRRRLRSILRELDPAPGWDFVMIAGPLAASAPYSALKSEVEDLLIKAGVPLSEIDSAQ